MGSSLSPPPYKGGVPFLLRGVNTIRPISNQSPRKVKAISACNKKKKKQQKELKKQKALAYHHNSIPTNLMPMNMSHALPSNINHGGMPNNMTHYVYASPPGSTIKPNYYSNPPGPFIPWPISPTHYPPTPSYLSFPSLTLGHTPSRRSVPSTINGGPVYSGVSSRHYHRNASHETMRRTLTKYTKF